MKNHLLTFTFALFSLSSFSQEKKTAAPQPKDPTIALSKADLKKDSLNALKMDAEVISFEVTYQKKGTLITQSCSGNKMSGNTYEAMLKAAKGTTFYVEKIVAKGKDGKEIKKPTRIYRIAD